MSKPEILGRVRMVALLGICAGLLATTVTLANPATDEAVIVADAHIHHGLTFTGETLEFEAHDYFTQRGVQIIAYPMPIQRSRVEDLVSLIATEVRRMHLLSGQSGEFTVTGSPRDIDDISGPLNVVLSIEYFHGVFGNDPTTVERYRQMGIRSITIINNDDDRFFSTDLLTEFGTQVIRTMNEQDILVDISHLSEKQALEVIAFSTRPVIASHSAASAVTGDAGNLSDAVLKALKTNGGYVFASFNRSSLFDAAESGDDGLGRFVDHVMHLAGILGVDHVGIGSDYQADGRYVPTDLNSAETYRLLRDRLKEAGFSESDTRMVMSGAFFDAFNTRR